MAKQAGIDLAALKGSGPNGRIVRADIEAAQQGGAQAAGGRSRTAQPAAAPVQAAAPRPAAPAPQITAPHPLVPEQHDAEGHRAPPERGQADRSRISIVTMDMEIDALLKLRAELNAKSPKDGPGAFKLSVNDLVIKAAAITLRRVPKVNASYTEDNIVLYDDVDISVAVSIPDGLITPIIRRADQKGLAADQQRDEGPRGRAPVPAS